MSFALTILELSAFKVCWAHKQKNH